MLHVLALLGVLSISFSAVFVRLASVSPVTATFFRTVYALPILAVAWLATRREDRRGARARALAIGSGLILALDLDLWHESIALIGAGLGTVIANVQVVFVALAAWALYGERPTRRTTAIVGVVLAGVALTSGLARHDAYGARPVLGAMLGLLSGVSYAVYLLVFRASNKVLAPTAGPLLDTTLGAALGAVVSIAADPHFVLRPFWPAHLWLVLLALGSQVFGWWFIATALPRLPAVETSILLLGQPVFAVIWGVLFFAEKLSVLQWMGAVLVLSGVAALSTGGVVRIRKRSGPVEAH